MKNKLRSVQEYIERHQKAILLGAIAVAVIASQQKSIRMMNKFLVDHDLFNEYYYPEGEI